MIKTKFIFGDELNHRGATTEEILRTYHYALRVKEIKYHTNIGQEAYFAIALACGGFSTL